MAWQGVFGIEEIALQFARANARGRLGGSFLFVGPQGIGKRVFAFQLAKTLLCRRQFVESGSPILRDGESVESASNEELLARFQPCGECDSCKQFDFDVAATEVAKQLRAHKLVFVSEVNGVRTDPNDPNSMIDSLTADEARKLLASGAIVGGMIPKIQSCLKTIERGVEKIHIINGRLRHAILLEIFTSQGVGTEIVNERRS